MCVCVWFGVCCTSAVLNWSILFFDVWFCLLSAVGLSLVCLWITCCYFSSGRLDSKIGTEISLCKN